MLVAQYELTIPARKEALLTLAWSNVWFLVKYDPPDEDDDWLRLLTEVSYRYLLHGNVTGITDDMSADAARSSFKRSISEPTMSAHPHDGGLAFPLPAHNVRAILCTLMLELMEPYGANQPDPTGAAWNAIPLTLMLRAADAPLDHSVGLLYETDWVYLCRHWLSSRGSTRAAANIRFPRWFIFVTVIITAAAVILSSGRRGGGVGGAGVKVKVSVRANVTTENEPRRRKGDRE
jgi:hypothetical protein